MLVAVAVAVVAVAGIALAVGLAWRRSARGRAAREAAYSPLPLPEPCAFARFARAAGVAVTPEEIATRLRLAMDCLDEHWPAGWPAAPVRGIAVVVRSETEWTDAYGRRVAGLAYPAQGIMVVGADLAALCHELVELLYWRLEGGECWHEREWPGRASVEAACAAYAARRMAA